MIFVTVGTYSFDELIRQVDKLVMEGLFKEQEVVCQIGSGDYIPSSCQFFRYEEVLTPYYDKANFVICHGGTGSTIECIRTQKPFIAIANKALTDNHQVEFLKALSSECQFIWTDSPFKIEHLYQKALAQKLNYDIDTIYDALIEDIT